MKNKAGFTLIELLIVIALIGILTAAAARLLGGDSGRAARDAGRVSNLQQIATQIESFKNRFGVPPLSSDRSNLPPDCKNNIPENLAKCFAALQRDDKARVEEMFTDERHGISVLETEHKYAYYYNADDNNYKICAFLEDQGAYERLNADANGKKRDEDQALSDTEAYMYCIAKGSKAWELDVSEVDPKLAIGAASN
jgi:prepilin-type N-terminal cleavage/methylation domain-containing protein